MTLFGRLRMLLLRTIAYLIDSFILFILVICGFQILLLFTGLHPFMGRAIDGIGANELHMWVFTTVTIPIFFYFVTMFNTRAQATLGMRAVKLRIKSQERVGIGKAMLRALVLLIPWELTHIALFYPTPIFNNPHILSPLLFVSGAVTLFYWTFPLLNKGGRGVHDWAAATNIAKWDT